MKMDKAKHNILRAFCMRNSIGIGFDKGVEHVWEELHYCLPGQLDELADKLSGKPGFSTNKNRALERLRPLVQHAFGLKEQLELLRKVLGADTAVEKKRIRIASREEDDVTEVPTNSEGDEDMKTQSTTKKHAGFGAAPAKKTETAKKVGSAKKPVERGITVAQIIRDGLEARKSDDAILVLIKKKVPGSKATAAQVAWYRWKAKQ